MLEDDYSYLKRIHEYAQRRWKEPLVCTYLWDRYDLDVKLLNRKRLLCRTDVDYAYDDDFNLRIILNVNPKSPFINQKIYCSASAYNSSGYQENGHFILYMNDDESDNYTFIGELPISHKIEVKDDFKLIAKFYTLDETDFADTINPEDDVNLSEIVSVHVRDYTDSNYYVSDDGDDSNPGTMEEPFLTLQHACDKVNINDTICCLTDLTIDNFVVIPISCNIIGKETYITLESESEEYFIILKGVEVYLQDLELLTPTDYSDYGDMTFDADNHISNVESPIVTVQSSACKSYTQYDLDIISDGYWNTHETITLTLIDKKQVLNGVEVRVYNIFNDLIATIDTDGSESYSFKYTVPGVNLDRITVLANDYSYSEEFEVYNITSDWYVDTEKGDDNNTGMSLNDAFKTLNCAIQHVRYTQNHIFFVGSEIIDNLLIDNTIIMNGIPNRSTLYAASNYYFTINKLNTLYLYNINMDNNVIDEVSYTNNGNSLLEVLKYKSDKILYVDGISGSDNNKGTSWNDALKTLKYALTFGNIDSIYFSGNNTITAPLDIIENLTIIGIGEDPYIFYSSNDCYNIEYGIYETDENEDTYIDCSSNDYQSVQFFNIPKDIVLKLNNISLKSDNFKAHIESNEYDNNGVNNMEVRLYDEE
jgi:hypothetical protein